MHSSYDMAIIYKSTSDSVVMSPVLVANSRTNDNDILDGISIMSSKGNELMVYFAFWSFNSFRTELVVHNDVSRAS